ncbi:hypothetical protein BV372_14325 [Nostoc sp. T09]|uniref:hypothetical protein n=1 Tax=Nostoc sp. T09 TaxID=1932621 RepID=UPI000A38B630|nr:hypothetical protein [Nostoc sp. T09]OUL34290.1 hypothetical protein BV372_14325 [Nostoc sp. T09]
MRIWQYSALVSIAIAILQLLINMPAQAGYRFPAYLMASNRDLPVSKFVSLEQLLSKLQLSSKSRLIYTELKPYLEYTTSNKADDISPDRMIWEIRTIEFEGKSMGERAFCKKNAKWTRVIDAQTGNVLFHTFNCPRDQYIPERSPFQR